MAKATEAKAAPEGKRGLIAWCLYDWANSAFPTVIVTFVFAAYFTQAVASDVERGTGQWGTAMGLSGLVVAILAPIFGAIADSSGRRKPWLLTLSLICITAGAALWFIEPEARFIVAALILAGLANAAFELATVFYNAMLPDLAPRHMLGRVSGWAWGLGYAGGLACLAVALVVLVQPDPALFGLERENAEHVRATGPLVALWYLLFAAPLFIWTPDRPSNGLSPAAALRAGLASLRATLSQLGRYRRIARFLIARMLYTDGLNTLFAFGGIYAAGTFGMSIDEILIFGLILNVTSGLGAVAFAWIDDWIGAKPTVVIAVVALIALGGAILLVEGKIWFYVLGSAIGVFIGPAQSASRSLMARMAPPELATEMFGLYALSGKATAFLGPLMVGWTTVAMGSQRWGMATILLLFVAGLLILLPLKVEPAAGPET